MWLLNAETKKLESFMDERMVKGKYAILSHTWEKDEVLFDEIQDEVLFEEIYLPAGRMKSGYRKIEYTCKQAVADGLKYVWIDTCCIDKKSSAELSEAINSMYAWYYHAAVCYVYLSDLSERPYFAKYFTGTMEAEPLRERLARCRWFTRGWTLQELIAPKEVHFFNREWTRVPEIEKTPRSRDLLLLAWLTGIAAAVLRDRDLLKQTSIADRLHWAAFRKTTRLEDQAYCLLGILDVNMPLHYGEGQRAFARLQEEVIRMSSSLDHSILFHHGKDLLAKSPIDFGYRQWSGDVSTWSLPQAGAFELTNLGLRITLLVDASTKKDSDECTTVAFNCCPSKDGLKRMGLTLRKRPQVSLGVSTLGTSSGTDVFDKMGDVFTLDASQWRDFVLQEIAIARHNFHWPEDMTQIEVQSSSRTLICQEQDHKRGSTSIVLDLNEVDEVEFDELQAGMTLHGSDFGPSRDKKIRQATVGITSTELSRAGYIDQELCLYVICSKRQARNVTQPPDLVALLRSSSFGSGKAQRLNTNFPSALGLRGKDLLQVEAQLTIRSGVTIWSLRLSDLENGGNCSDETSDASISLCVPNLDDDQVSRHDSVLQLESTLPGLGLDTKEAPTTHSTPDLTDEQSSRYNTLRDLEATLLESTELDC